MELFADWYRQNKPSGIDLKIARLKAIKDPEPDGTDRSLWPVFNPTRENGGSRQMPLMAPVRDHAEVIDAEVEPEDEVVPEQVHSRNDHHTAGQLSIDAEKQVGVAGKGELRAVVAQRTVGPQRRCRRCDGDLLQSDSVDLGLCTECRIVVANMAAGTPDAPSLRLVQ